VWRWPPEFLIGLGIWAAFLAGVFWFNAAVFAIPGPVPPTAATVITEY
jgi:hypothetical protein